MDRIIEIKVGGNYLTKDSKNAGVRGEGNVTIMRITFDEGWDDYTKKVTFWDARGLNPVEITLTESLLKNIKDSTRVYLVPIPSEPMAEAGMFTFVIDGYVDGKRQRTIADKLEVKDSPIAENAGNATAPTPTQYEQLQSNISKLTTDMQNAVIATDKAIEARMAAETSSENARQFANEATEQANQAEQSAIVAQEIKEQIGQLIGENKVFSDNNFSDEDKEKLDRLSEEIRANAESLKNKVDKDGNKVLSDNNYSDEDKEKLDGLSSIPIDMVNKLLGDVITAVDTSSLVIETVIPYSDVTDIANRWSHLVNTVIQEPDFYQTLDVTVGGEAKTIEVDWVSSDYKYNVAGTYTFTAVADGYEWGCDVPKITVKVINGAYSTDNGKATGLISAETNGIPVVFKGDSGVDGRLNQIYDATGCNVLAGVTYSKSGTSTAGISNKVYAYPGISAAVSGTGTSVKETVYTGKTTGNLCITLTDSAHVLVLAAGNRNIDHEGNTYITVKNASAGTGSTSTAGICAGAYANGKTVVTKGNTYIDVSGLVNIDNIYGGGREEDSGAKSSLDGTTYVTIHDLTDGSRIGKITRKASRGKGEATNLVINLDDTSAYLYYAGIIELDDSTAVYINNVEQV